MSDVKQYIIGMSIMELSYLITMYIAYNLIINLCY